MPTGETADYESGPLADALLTFCIHWDVMVTMSHNRSPPLKLGPLVLVPFMFKGFTGIVRRYCIGIESISNFRVNEYAPRVFS